MAICYEWDDAKRRANLDKHGFDFIEAELVYEAPDQITLDVSRPGDGEARFATLAEVRGAIVTLVYTERNGAVRCISMRLASEMERTAFHEQDR